MSISPIFSGAAATATTSVISPVYSDTAVAIRIRAVSPVYSGIASFIEVPLVPYRPLKAIDPRTYAEYEEGVDVLIVDRLRAAQETRRYLWDDTIARTIQIGGGTNSTGDGVDIHLYGGDASNSANGGDIISRPGMGDATGLDGSTIFQIADGTEVWRVDSSGDLVAGTDNVYDIGRDETAGPTLRPRKIFVGTEVVVGDTVTIGSNYINCNSGLTIDVDPTAAVTIHGALDVTGDVTADDLSAKTLTANQTLTVGPVSVVDSAGSFAIGNGTYSVSFDASSGEMALMGELRVGTSAVGTGSSGDIVFGNAGQGQIFFDTSAALLNLYNAIKVNHTSLGIIRWSNSPGSLSGFDLQLGRSTNGNLEITGGGIIFDTDNVYDIGNDDGTAPGENRPRKVFVGTEVVVGDTIVIGTDSITGSDGITITPGGTGSLMIDGDIDVTGSIIGGGGVGDISLLSTTVVDPTSTGQVKVYTSATDDVIVTRIVVLRSSVTGTITTPGTVSFGTLADTGVDNLVASTTLTGTEVEGDVYQFSMEGSSFTVTEDLYLDVETATAGAATANITVYIYGFSV